MNLIWTPMSWIAERIKRASDSDEPSWWLSLGISAMAAVVAVIAGVIVVTWFFHPAYWGTFALHIVAVFGVLIWGLAWLWVYGSEKLQGESGRERERAAEVRHSYWRERDEYKRVAELLVAREELHGMSAGEMVEAFREDFGTPADEAPTVA
jgi:hypothetical protein